MGDLFPRGVLFGVVPGEMGVVAGGGSGNGVDGRIRHTGFAFRDGEGAVSGISGGGGGCCGLRGKGAETGCMGVRVSIPGRV